MANPFKWTEENYAEMKAEYEARMAELGEDASKQSAEVVQEIATAHGATTNGLRMKLSKDGVYIKKDPATASTSTKSEGAKSTGGRISKATAHAEFRAACTDAGISDEDIDAEILDKLTGKAAVHLAELIRKATK